MMRLLFLIIILAGMVFSAGWLRDTSGFVTVEWMGYRIEASTSVLLAVAIGLIFTTLLLHNLYLWVSRGPARLRQRITERKRDAGYHQLMDGFTAVAAADAHSAKKLSQQARKQLGDTPLTLLLAAQTAQLEGNEGAAQAHYQAMLSQRDSEFLGLRGLLSQQRKQGLHDTDSLNKSVELAERANKIRPGTSWVLLSLFEYYCRLERWDDARASIKQALKHKTLDKREATRKQALVSYLEALSHSQRQQTAAALDSAKVAVNKNPCFVPAIHLLASLYHQLGEQAAALKTVEKGWRQVPHPMLADLYESFLREETPEKRLKRFEKLISKNPSHIESHLAIANAALRSGQTSRARNHLKSALAVTESAEACKRMAALEQQEAQSPGLGSEEKRFHTAAAADWLQRATEAPHGPGWHCGQCHAFPPQWTPYCPQCSSFDSVSWDAPVATAPLPLRLYSTHGGID